MLLFHCILILMNNLFQRENHVFKPNSLFVLLYCVCGERLGLPILSPLHYFLTFQFICQSFGLNSSYTVSEHSLWTDPKKKFKLTSIKLNVSSKYRGGERPGRPILPPPPFKMLLPFYLSLCLHNPFTVSELL